MDFKINYDPTLNKEAGYVQIHPDTEHEPLRARDAQTLLHLLFHLLYTWDGRELMRKNKPGPGGLAPENRNNLLARFNAFGVTDPGLQEALIAAHVAAENWVNAFKAGPLQDQERKTQENIYLQNMAFITWCLWEDATTHEFSMGW